MSDIFSVSPPAWLQELTHSDDKGLLGSIVGELVGGAAIATKRSLGDEHKNWFKELPESIGDAQLALFDPMYKLKVQQAQSEIAHRGLVLQEMQQKINVNATNMKLRAQDIQNIPKWMSDHPTVESRTGAEWPTAMTPEWNRNLDQLRLRDSQSEQSKIKVKGVEAFNDRVKKLPEDLASGFVKYFGKQPPPEAFSELETAEQIVGAKKEQERLKAEGRQLRGEATVETLVTEKGVQTIYRQPNLVKTDPVAIARRARVGTEMTTPSGIHAVWVGPDQIRITPKTGEKKDFTSAQLIAIANVKSIDDPDAKAILKFLGEQAMSQIGGKTNAPSSNASKKFKLNPATGLLEPVK